MLDQSARDLILRVADETRSMIISAELLIGEENAQQFVRAFISARGRDYECNPSFQDDSPDLVCKESIPEDQKDPQGADIDDNYIGLDDGLVEDCGVDPVQDSEEKTLPDVDSTVHQVTERSVHQSGRCFDDGSIWSHPVKIHRVLGCYKTITWICFLSMMLIPVSTISVRCTQLSSVEDVRLEVCRTDHVSCNLTTLFGNHPDHQMCRDWMYYQRGVHGLMNYARRAITGLDHAIRYQNQYWETTAPWLGCLCDVQREWNSNHHYYNSVRACERVKKPGRIFSEVVRMTHAAVEKSALIHSKWKLRLNVFKRLGQRYLSDSECGTFDSTDARSLSSSWIGDDTP